MELLGNGICSDTVVNFCSFYGPLTTKFPHVLSAEYVHFIPYHKMSLVYDELLVQAEMTEWTFLCECFADTAVFWGT